MDKGRLQSGRRSVVIPWKAAFKAFCQLKRTCEAQETAATYLDRVLGVQYNHFSEYGNH